jgi:cytochrome c-type biogenesis protein CcmH/NrfG
MLYIILFFIVVAASLLLLWPLRKEKAPGAWLLLFMIASSFGIYLTIGKPDIIPLMKERNQRLAELRIQIQEDSGQVKRDTKDVAAWIRLGTAFMQTGQYGAAANAFKQAVLLTNGAPDVIMAYAKATIAADDGKVNDASKKSLEMVLLQKPEHKEARYWLIVRRVQDGEGETAMKDMQSLYRSLPDDSPLKAMINRQIGRE